VSHGGVAVTLAEMVGDAGADVTLPGDDPLEALFSEAVGRVVVETTDPDAVRSLVPDAVAVDVVGEATDDERLTLSVDGETLEYSASRIAELRDVIASGLE